MAEKETQQQTIDRLTGELAEANRKIAEFTAQKAQAGADEQIIAAKMAVGLTREQAVSVIRRQRQFDQAYGAPESPAAV